MVVLNEGENVFIPADSGVNELIRDGRPHTEETSSFPLIQGSMSSSWDEGEATLGFIFIPADSEGQ